MAIGHEARTRHTGLSFFLDANCVDARQRVDALNALERYRDEGYITLMYSDVAYDEAAHGSAARAEKVFDYSYTVSNPDGVENPEVLEQIKRILFPQGSVSPNEDNDARIVYDAERLGWPLIMRDGASKTQPRGILGCAAELAAIGIEVITPETALARVNAMLVPQAARP